MLGKEDMCRKKREVDKNNIVLPTSNQVSSIKKKGRKPLVVIAVAKQSIRSKFRIQLFSYPLHPHTQSPGMVYSRVGIQPQKFKVVCL